MRERNKSSLILRRLDYIRDMDIKNTIIELVKAEAGVERVNLEDKFMDDIAMSSLEIFSLIAEIEEQFNLKVVEEEIEGIISVRDLVELVQRKLS